MLAESYKKVSYDLRPKKQIERKMIIETFHFLANAGFPIRDYEYVGFGSTFFVDFILLHRLLGIDKMISIENDKKIKNRVEFNRPFKFIEIQMGEFIKFISKINKKSKYIVWLDYDKPIDGDQIRDISSAVASLPVGSIFLVTADAEPPLKDRPPKEWLEYYKEQVGSLLDETVLKKELSRENLHLINIGILRNAILSGSSRREGGGFYPLFNFLYADGHKMVSFGGVIADEEELIKLKSAKLEKLDFVRTNIKNVVPYEILIPILTRKERSYLDSKMPSKKGWTPTEFEISEEEVWQYQNVYRYYPLYVELLF